MGKAKRGLEKPMPQRIKALAERIARRFHPDKVILFGSYAYGVSDGESDVDLLVIMKTTLRPVEQALAIRQAVDFPSRCCDVPVLQRQARS